MGVVVPVFRPAYHGVRAVLRGNPGCLGFRHLRKRPEGAKQHGPRHRLGAQRQNGIEKYGAPAARRQRAKGASIPNSNLYPTTAPAPKGPHSLAPGIAWGLGVPTTNGFARAV